MSNLQQTEVAPPPLPAAVNIDIDSTTARESTVVAEQQETPNEETPKAENAAVAIDVAVAQMEEDKLDEESNILQQRQKRKINAPCRLHDASEWEKVMDGPQLKKAAIKPHTNTNANTPTTLATAKDLTTAFASTGDEKQNKENEQENEHEDWRAKDTGTGLDKNGRPQRRTKGVAPARLADADQWKKVMVSQFVVSDYYFRCIYYLYPLFVCLPFCFSSSFLPLSMHTDRKAKAKDKASLPIDQ